MKSLIKTLLISSIFLINSIFSLAEGTKELMPTAADFGFLQIWDQNSATRQFASFNCPADNRLNIKICNTGEKIYLGFKQTDNNVYFRLKDPNGVIVMGPTLIPSTGTGFINAWSNAVAGPIQIVGAAGYDAIVYTSTMAGDYSIEFNGNSPTVVNISKRVFTYFDATVADAANNIKTGRLWSKAWDFTTNGALNQFKAKMYVYANDSIVTSLDFNGMQPFGFVVSCNSKGCTNTGNVVLDRQSRIGNTTFPEYKIFLNDPDPSCYPTGTFGSLTSSPSVSGCGSNRCINISVDKAGYIEVTLDINGVHGYQAGTSDRILSANVIVGSNCIPWDGKDGLGNYPTTGINIGASINYFNGLTHLPIYDIEDNKNGFIVGLVRPLGPAPKLFWDDSPIPNASTNALDGVTNLLGCSNAAGCHRFQGRGNNSCVPVCPETVNTWWYADEDTASLPYFYVAISADANTTNPPLAINDITVCANTYPWQLNGGVGGATGGIWSGAGTFNNGPSDTTNNLTGTYTPTPAEITAGLAKLVITTTGNPGGCPGVTDTLKIHINPVPTANAGADQTICTNNSLVTLNGSFTVATGASWSGGSGTFSPGNTTMNSTYKPTAAELSTGTHIILTLLTTGNGLCNAVSDQMQINITPVPIVNAGIDRTICLSNPTITLNGSISNAGTGSWIGGTGTFNPGRNTLNATYTLSAAELTAGSLTLYLSSGTLPCLAVKDTMNITVVPIPIVDAGVDRSVCFNNATLALSGSVTNAMGGTWTTAGTGTFSPNATTLNATYTLSATEKATGVTLTLTSISPVTTTCTPVTDAMSISVTTAPNATVSTKTFNVCSNNMSVALNGTITGATGSTWTGGAGTFVPNANTLNATYTPSAGEIIVGIASLILNTTGNGNCNADKDTTRIIIVTPPTVNAGSDQSLCSNKATISLSGTVNQTPVTPAVPRVWTPGGSTSLTPTYNPNAAEIATGSITFTLTASKATCLPVSDQVTVIFTPSPTINAGPDQTVCKNNPAVSLSGSTTLATGGIWSGGNGTYAPGASSLITTYTPSAAEVTAGIPVKLILTSSGNANCNSVKDSMLINFSPVPTSNAGPAQTICANNANVVLNGSVTVASGGLWSGGLGTFSPNRNILNATYTPSASEISGGSVTLSLITAGNGNCNPVSSNMTITISPAPVANAGTDKIVCADNPTIHLNGLVTITNSGDWSGGSGSYSPNATTLITTYTPSASEILTGSVTLTLTSTNNLNCNSASDQILITIIPAPSIDAGPNQSICGALTTVNLNGSVTGSSGGQWSTGGSGTFSPNANILNATYLPSPADKTAGTVTLTLISTGNGVCNAISDNMDITFTPIPTINAGPDKIVCTNKFPIKLAAIGSPSTWSGGTGTFAPNANSLNASYTPSAAEVTAGAVTLTITTTPSGSCPSAIDAITYSIPPGPATNAGPDQTICGNLPSVTLTGTFSNSAGVKWTSTGTGTFSPSNTTTSPSYIASAADKISGSVTLTITTTGNGSCSSSNDKMKINFTPVITVNAGADQSFCSNNAVIPLNGSVINATGGIWSGGSGIFAPNNTALLGTYTPTASEISSGSLTLTLTSQGNGTCSAQTDNVTFTFTPGPSVNAGPDQTVCGDITSFTLNGSVLVASGGTWTTTGSGTFSPNASTLNASYFPSVTDFTSGKVKLALTTAGNGTCNAIIDSMVLIITPKPTINAGPDQTVCADIAGVILSGSKTVATTGTWTSTGAGTFTPSATTLNASYIPTSTDISNGTVSLTLSSSNAGTCLSVNDVMVITITPAPTVNAGPAQNVCSDIPTVNLNGNITVATGGAWTTTGSGTFANASAAITTYTPGPTDRTSPSVTLTLSTTGNGTCMIKTSQAIISFTPKPTVNAGPDQTICSDSANIKLTEIITSATGGIWTSSGSGAFSTSTVAMNPQYIPSAADRTLALITLTLTSTGNGPCSAVADQMLIHVTPAPTINAGPDQTVCSTLPSINLNGTKTVASGILWTSSGSGTFSPNNTTLNASYSPSASDKNAGTVTLTGSSSGNGTCKTATDQMVITITPAPTVNAGPDATVCGDISSINLNGSLTNASGSTWTSTGAGNYLPDINNLHPTYFPNSTELGGTTITFTLTSNGSGICPNASDQMILVITPKPTANAGSDQTICADATGVSLTGIVNAASGGIWVSLGSGVFAPNANSLSANYIPSAADKTTGTVTLKLTTTGIGTCNSVSDNMVVTIRPVPAVNAGPDITVCADADGISLAGTVSNATGGLWSTNGSGAFSPDNTSLNATYSYSASDIAAGNVTLTLTTTGIGSCNPVSDNMTIIITPAPTVNAGPDVTVCVGTINIPLNGIVTVATGGSWITLGTGTFTPDVNTLNASYSPSAADAAAGSVTLALTTTGNGTCNFYSDNITIMFGTPAINAGPDQTVCTTNYPVQLAGSGTTGVWSGGGTFSPNPNALNASYTPSAGESLAGIATLTLTTTNNGVCIPGTDNIQINIIPGPTANAGSPLSICANIDSVQLNGVITAPASSGIWTTSGSGSFIPNATTLNAYYKPSSADKTAGSVLLTLTTAGNGLFCTAVTSTVSLIISPTPAVNAGFDQILCANAPNALLNGSSVPAGATWSSSGTGSFLPGNNTLNATYSPSAADISSGAILSLTIPGSSSCNIVKDDMNISYTPAPTVNAGNDTTICADIAFVKLKGVVTIASGGLWTSSGTGTFSPGSNNLNASYNFSASDLSGTSLTLTLSSTGNGSCTTVTDDRIITIKPKPTVNAGISQTVCGNNSIAVLNGSFTLASGINWTSSGSGTFSTSTTILNPTYTPSNADIAAGAVNVTLTTIPDPLTGCNAVSDVITITISPSPTASVNAGFDKTVCEDATSVSLNGAVTVAGGGAWTVSGGTGTFNPGINNLNASYIPTAADKTAGSVNIILTTILNGSCKPVADTMLLSFTPAPTVNADIDQLVCSDTSGVILNGAVTIATGGTWTSTGSGTFAPNSATLSATYILSAADISAGSAGLTLHTTGNGTCNPVTDFMLISINKKPLPNAGADKFVCSDVTSIPLSGTISFATARNWTTSGTGTFTPGSTATNASYLPSAADIASTKVNLTLTATDGTGLCKPEIDQMSITFTPIPVINAGTDQTVCADLNSISVSGSFTIATGGAWTSSGTGIFVNPNSASTTYTPSAADTATKNIKLIFTSTGNGTCKPVTDTVAITITPKPIINAGTPVSCVYTAGVPLTGSVLIASGGHWTSSGSGNFSLNNDILNASYFPTAADFTAGGVTLTLTSTGNGTCNPVFSTTTIDLAPLPIANAGADQFICRNAGTLLSAQTFSNVNYQWSTLSPVIIGNSSTLNITASTDTTFMLTVTDIRGCLKTDTVKVFVVDPPVLALPGIYCFSNFLTINAHPSSISPIGVFQWFRNGVILTGMNDSTLTVTQSGTYKITYSVGSCSYSATTDVTDPPVLKPHAKQIACIGNSVSLTSSTTSTPVTYSWTSSNGSAVGTPNSTSNPITISAISDTNYYFVNVTQTINSCSSKDSFMVIGIPKPNINIHDTTVCQGQVVKLIGRPKNLANLDSLHPVYTWKYNGLVQNSVNDTLFPTLTGLYNLTVTIGGCDTSANANITMQPNPSPVPQSANFCQENGGIAILDAGNTGSTYNWLIPTNDITQTIKVGTEGTYKVIITNQFNCIRKDSIHLRNTCPPHIYVPNTFTPDCEDCADQLDKIFKVWGTNFDNSTLETFVFNRWGEIIFHGQGQEEAWDGRYRGVPMPIGSYVWLVTYEGKYPEFKGPYKDKGNITIIR